jgi:hypothetical protein
VHGFPLEHVKKSAKSLLCGKYCSKEFNVKMTFKLKNKHDAENYQRQIYSNKPSVGLAQSRETIPVKNLFHAYFLFYFACIFSMSPHETAFETCRFFFHSVPHNYSTGYD